MNTKIRNAKKRFRQGRMTLKALRVFVGKQLQFSPFGKHEGFEKMTPEDVEILENTVWTSSEALIDEPTEHTHVHVHEHVHGENCNHQQEELSFTHKQKRQ